MPHLWKPGGHLAYIVSGAENSVVCRQFMNIIITATPTFCLKRVSLHVYRYNIHVEMCILVVASRHDMDNTCTCVQQFDASTMYMYMYIHVHVHTCTCI